jgi:peptide/nickel transport system substrate-binding protein
MLESDRRLFAAAHRGLRGRPTTRREVLRGLALGTGALAVPSWLTACSGSETSTDSSAGEPKRGGSLRMGGAGGGAVDTIDAHKPTSKLDIARVHQLYEPLMIRDRDFNLEPLVAESVEPNKDLTVWTARIREGLTFHDGRPVRPEDVIASYQRILDPQTAASGAQLLSFLDPRNGMRKRDDRTVEFTLEKSSALFLDAISEYLQGIVPEDYDPANPVGTGAFKYESFEPGQQSVFTRFDEYWREGEPYVDEVVIVDFPDDSARVNALLSGDLEAIESLPYGQITTVEGNQEFTLLESETGNWNPFTMRVDVAPFSDVRVRQAMRLLVDRQQMVDQVLVGHGTIANDIYCPGDPCYNDSLPQREQDIDQAKSLLAAAGQEGLQVELTTSPVAQGIVEAAQVFVEQAREAGVEVRLNKVDTGVFYGDDYLSWPFAQDFWGTRSFLAQVAQGSLPTSPYNETHWADEEFIDLVTAAEQEPDEDKRCMLIQDAQEIEYDSGGHIVWGFINLVDAYTNKITGLEPNVAGHALDRYGFRHAWFV